MIEIIKILKDKIPTDLLYLADSDKEQILKYINNSLFFGAIIDNKVIGIVGLKESSKTELEIVNIAVYEEHQNKKNGRNLLNFAIEYAKDKEFRKIIIKTGNSSVKQFGLYMKCGFRMESIEQNYFNKHYKDPIYENGIQCQDQVKLSYIIYSKKDIENRVFKYWKNFIKVNPEYSNSAYEVWSFGADNYQANELIGLVKDKIKTGTSSAYDMYGKDEKRPEKGDISIITYCNGFPGCIIKTTEIKNKRFIDINDEEARLEGEGDLSLKYWRAGHKEFFMNEYNDKGLNFTDQIPVIYEIFKVIYDEDRKS